MKTKLIKFFITTFVIVIVAMGVSYVSAQNIPPNGPTDPNTYTTDLPIFTGSALQEKKGSFLSQKHIGAPVGFFKKSIYLPGSDARLRIGSSDNALSINPALFGDDSTEPVVIDMQNRSATRDATKFINGGLCTVATRLVTTGSQAYEFKTGNNLGNVIARQVQLTGGDPDAGEVLVSDSSGNARWAKATVSGGQVIFDADSTSPVPAGQCITPGPVDLCTNIAGTQTTVPTNYHVDPLGSTTCVPDTVSAGGCPTGQHLSTQFMNSAQVRNAGGTWESCPTNPGNVRIMQIDSSGDFVYANGYCQKATGTAGGTLCPLAPAGSTGTGFVESCAWSSNFFYQQIRTCVADTNATPVKIDLPNRVTVTKSGNQIIERYQLGSLAPNYFAGNNVFLITNGIQDNTYLTNGTSKYLMNVQSISINSAGVLSITRNILQTIPATVTSVGIISNTTFKMHIQNDNLNIEFNVRDGNSTSDLSKTWALKEIPLDGSTVLLNFDNATNPQHLNTTVLQMGVRAI